MAMKAKYICVISMTKPRSRQFQARCSWPLAPEAVGDLAWKGLKAVPRTALRTEPDALNPRKGAVLAGDLPVGRYAVWQIRPDGVLVAPPVVP